jgi:tetratricopeptide (TPR) repeat protein
VTIACQGVDPQVLQPLNAMLATTDQDLHSNIRQAEAWVRTYHAVVQHLGADGRAHGLLQEAHILVQAGKLADAGALLDRVLASSDEAPPERLAASHFSRAELFALPFQFREARPHYAAAARRHEPSPQFAYRYAVVLQQQGQYTEVEPLYRAALQALRPLVSADPTTYVPAVALALDSLASLYHALQHFPEAEAVYQEAVTTYRQLAQTQFATYLPEVAAMLHNVGVFYRSTRRFAEAEAAYQEALTIYRQLAQAYPAASLPDIATTLTNLGVLYDRTQRLPKAEAAYQEALALRRQLAQTHPKTYLPKVATTLTNLGALYTEARRFAEAETAFQEALTMRRRLAQTNPTGALSDVAATLTSLARLALAQQRSQPAMEWIREAVTIHRTLWQHDPVTYGDALAQSVALEAVTLKRTGAATPVVCARLHEAARGVSDARLTQVVHQRLQAWCGATGQQEQR